MPNRRIAAISCSPRASAARLPPRSWDNGVKPVGNTVTAGEGAKPSGYRDSEHIRKYYKTTEV